VRVEIIAVGTRMPGWVTEPVAEYQKRLGKELALTVNELPLGRRPRSGDATAALRQEGEAMLAKIKPGSFVVALEVTGKALSTEALAGHLRQLAQNGRNLTLLVGGPDGLTDSCRQRADVQWSLSALTLPHPLVRVILAEQLYRAHSLNKGHPYHRA
jgi:23S rRNA (pseudouridine1915-N3)-methyltransferase